MYSIACFLVFCNIFTAAHFIQTSGMMNSSVISWFLCVCFFFPLVLLHYFLWCFLWKSIDTHVKHARRMMDGNFKYLNIIWCDVCVCVFVYTVNVTIRSISWFMSRRFVQCVYASLFSRAEDDRFHFIANRFRIIIIPCLFVASSSGIYFSATVSRKSPTLHFCQPIELRPKQFCLNK